MGIAEELGEELKTAMRAKDAQKLSCIRQVKAKILEATTAKGFTGEVNDELYLQVIGSYVKTLQKGMTELPEGERGAGLRNQYQWEVDYLAKYLPQLLGEAETLAIVKAKLEETGVSDPKQMGRVMGAIMKDHKGELDPGLTRTLLEKELGGS